MEAPGRRGADIPKHIQGAREDGVSLNDISRIFPNYRQSLDITRQSRMMVESNFVKDPQGT
jgi:hypothetical protein